MPRLSVHLAVLALAFLSILAPCGRAFALAGPWWENDHGRVRLVAATDGVGGASELRAGLEFEMAPGWKIYWRNPGDAGYPPRADWAASTNVADVALSWPAPRRFEVLGFQTLGYHDRVILPLDVLVGRPDQPVRLAARLDYLTCDDICIPYTADIALDLPALGGRLDDSAQDIDRWRAQVPVEPAIAGFRLDALALAGDASSKDMVLAAEIFSETPMLAPDIFVEGPDGAWFDRPRLDLSADGRSARLTMAGGGADTAAILAEGLTLTVVDGPRAAETRATPVAGALEGGSGFGLSGLLGMLGLAFLGGLILNLMPCVLPVLSLKLMSVLGHAGQAPRTVRRGFLASAAGIVLSFLVLAGGLIALKLAGAGVGWGIQFQQPAFLAFMMGVTILFACNLLGLFDFALPGRLGDALAGTGRREEGLGQHFLTGVFATLLATPCSAPFLGTAVGFALARGVPEILAIFTALGLGLATPYLAVAAFPGLARHLPRPGRWFVWLRGILALALIGTAIWLGGVIWVQAGAETAGIAAVFALMIAAVLGLRRLPGSRLGRRSVPLALGILAVMTLHAALAPNRPQAATGQGEAETGTIAWVPFEETRIDRLVGEGRVVFVDVTAEWCITCQFNKLRVLQRASVSDLLNGPDMVAMQADWTLPDPAIAAYLQRYGRYGIPFNIIYGPGAPYGIPLPELLSADAVLDAVARAKAGTAKNLPR